METETSPQKTGLKLELEIYARNSVYGIFPDGANANVGGVRLITMVSRVKEICKAEFGGSVRPHLESGFIDGVVSEMVADGELLLDPHQGKYYLYPTEKGLNTLENMSTTE